MRSEDAECVFPKSAPITYFFLKKKHSNRLDKIERLFDWVGQMNHFTEQKKDGCDVFKEKVAANRGGEGIKLMADGRKPQCV